MMTRQRGHNMMGKSFDENFLSNYHQFLNKNLNISFVEVSHHVNSPCEKMKSREKEKTFS